MLNVIDIKQRELPDILGERTAQGLPKDASLQKYLDDYARKNLFEGAKKAIVGLRLSCLNDIIKEK